MHGCVCVLFVYFVCRRWIKCFYFFFFLCLQLQMLKYKILPPKIVYNATRLWKETRLMPSSGLSTYGAAHLYVHMYCKHTCMLTCTLCSTNETRVECCSFSVAVNCRKLRWNSCKQALTRCSPKSTLQVVKACFTFLSPPFFSAFIKRVVAGASGPQRLQASSCKT